VLREAERLFARKGYSATALREVAKVSGVCMFAVQYHFGSKPRLYEEIVRRWDVEVEQLVSRVLAEAADQGAVVERAVDALFDFFLANRARVALNARAALGEGVPRRLAIGDRSWVRFMSSTMKKHQLAAAGLNVGLLLITVEGILHSHILGRHHYRHLFGRDVTDPKMAAEVKRHLTRVILALVGSESTQHR
jgi:AcrR family transcriptional regulator